MCILIQEQQVGKCKTDFFFLKEVNSKSCISIKYKLAHLVYNKVKITMGKKVKS